MKRSDIRGFSFKIGKYDVEVVTYYHIPRTVAIYKDQNRKLVRRIGR